MEFLTELLYRIPAVLVALSFHEWAHAYAAYRLGDPTARNLGRMTINPFAHIDPVGFLTLMLFRFGWAKPVPISTRYFKNPRKDELIVSLAGVTTNLLLAFVSMGVFYLFAFTTGVNEMGANLFYTFFFLNVGLCVFNLLPIPPLDGYHVAQCLFLRGNGAYRFFSFLNQYGYIILLVLLFSGVLSTIMSPLVNGIVYVLQSIYMGIFQLLGIA
ncbi:MAG: site-2 protease family protein [Clostridia bacterium]|nr:site-2 protease family protein [Clostridia bacterium]